MKRQIKGKRGSAKESKSIERKKLTEFENKWGEICLKCGRRKGTFFTSGQNLSSTNNDCTCLADNK